jgi:hypothetical protein
MRSDVSTWIALADCDTVAATMLIPAGHECEARPETGSRLRSLLVRLGSVGRLSAGAAPSSVGPPELADVVLMRDRERAESNSRKNHESTNGHIVKKLRRRGDVEM